ncbi:LuxR C-terminal-related transcriptional regulator [Streptomyces sp. NPDC018031]|uniref:LuxR C-terminal-related transcriptional regulator n=1 Tax=Streptomyces sp. NPDC018031 TaxID=3365033 RepID=UPI0037B270A0
MTTERGAAEVLDAALHVRAAARDAVRGTSDAGAVLASLSEVIDYSYASLSRWDPLRRRHLTLAGSYPGAATAYIEDRLHDDPVFTRIRGSAGGVRWLGDVPGDRRAESPGFREVLEPIGVEDGVAQCLFAPDGRYVGVLNVSTVRPRHRHDPARAVMTLLNECLAAVADPAQQLVSGDGPAVAARPAAAAVVLPATPPSGPAPAPVPAGGVVPPELTDPGSGLVRLLYAAVARRPLPCTVLVPHGGRLLQFRLSAQDARDARNHGILAVCRPVALPAGLTLRELQVLAELCGGRTNREIAARLFVSPRTVGTHIEHILTKLGVPNRAAAAGRAAAWGLEPPP